jgi:hypothetical protein
LEACRFRRYALEDLFFEVENFFKNRAEPRRE